MPELDWNRKVWGESYDWSQHGEEWSGPWGGSEAQWHGSLLPRLRSFLPCRSIVEIATGYGRWTQYLLPLCQDFTGIDLSERCAEACRIRFPRRGRFFANDGYSLAGATDGTADLVFSYDSLVHVESDVLERYIPQIVDKLTPYGVALVHHSNFGDAPGAVEAAHSRSRSVTAAFVGDRVARSGGQVLRQELIPWGEFERLDCITLFCRAGAYSHAGAVHINNQFYQEAALIREHIAPWHFDRASTEASSPRAADPTDAQMAHVE